MIFKKEIYLAKYLTEAWKESEGGWWEQGTKTTDLNSCCGFNNLELMNNRSRVQF